MKWWLAWQRRKGPVCLLLLPSSQLLLLLDSEYPSYPPSHSCIRFTGSSFTTRARRPSKRKEATSCHYLAATHPSPASIRPSLSPLRPPHFTLLSALPTRLYQKAWASNARAPSPGQGASTTLRNARPAWGKKRSNPPTSPKLTLRPSNFTCPTNDSSPHPPPRPPSLPPPPPHPSLPPLRRARLCLNSFISATTTTSAREPWRCKD